MSDENRPTDNSQSAEDMWADACLLYTSDAADERG